MTTALDDFERQLVSASSALYEAAEVTHGPASQNGSVRRGRKLFRRLRQLGLGVQLGLAVASLGSGLAGYLLLSASDVARTLPSFECQIGPNDDAIVGAVTGDPTLDCAAAWPSATGGRSEAPPLAAWDSTTGRFVAVVRPASWGPPDGGSWRRLPAGWTVDLRIVILTDQLADVSLSPDGTLRVGRCTRTGAAVAAVRRLLAIDHMKSWRVVVRGSAKASGSSPCESYSPTVLADSRAVQLDPMPPSQLSRAERRATRKLYALSVRVNRALMTRCETVSAAAAMWTREARAAGMHRATLAYWRALNGANPPSTLPHHYTLYRQPAWQRTGTCAHVLVSVQGGGDVTVYAARIVP